LRGLIRMHWREGKVGRVHAGEKGRDYDLLAKTVVLPLQHTARLDAAVLHEAHRRARRGSKEENSPFLKRERQLPPRGGEKGKTAADHLSRLLGDVRPSLRRGGARIAKQGGDGTFLKKSEDWFWGRVARDWRGHGLSGDCQPGGGEAMGGFLKKNGRSKARNLPGPGKKSIISTSGAGT